MKKSTLVIVDPGHGGWDNGASWEGRLEKDDNLRLGLEVYRQLMAANVPAIITRDSDVYLTLSERTNIANNAGADLFVSLHRNSYPEQTPSAMGVENFIYLTAPEEPTARAAQIVLDNVVDVGVQANRGVSRGDYYVLRRTEMPAMLLEMGFIINEIDNELFDEHLTDYAAAIVRGIREYLGLAQEVIPPGCPACPDAGVMRAQIWMADIFGLDFPATGFYDKPSRRAAVMALQMAINNDLDAQIPVDGELGPITIGAFGRVFPGSRGNIVRALQLILMLRGYSLGTADGVFGVLTQQAVEQFQKSEGLPADGIIDAQTLIALIDG